MEVPISGALIFGLAVLFFLFSPRLLYAAMIVSIPFGATAVLNFPLPGVGYEGDKSIMAFQLLAVLWIVREALSRLPQWRRRGWFLTRRPRFWLLVFLSAAALSLVVPALVNGTSWIRTFELVGPAALAGNVPMRKPLRFTLYNLTQFAYLAFGIMIVVFVAAENSHPAKLFRTLRLYVWSCLFVAAWGLFQFWCYLTRHSYPNYLFNTSKNLSATGYTQSIAALGASWGRISSVEKEPSLLAQDLVVALAVLLVCMAFRRPLLRLGWNRFGVVLIVTVLTVSTATTAYVGIFSALIFIGIVLARAGKSQWKYYLAVALAGLGAVILVALEVPLVNSLVHFLLLQKYLGTNSGATRLSSVGLAAQTFLHYPILGAGWKAANCWDLIFLILANVGIVGLLAFSAFLWPVFRGLWRMIPKGSFWAASLLPVLAWVVISAEGGGLDYAGWFSWFFLGLAAGAVAATNMESSQGPAAKVSAIA